VNIRIAVVASTLGIVGSSSAFAQDYGTSTAGGPPKLTVQAQAELMPLGSVSGTTGGITVGTDTAVAYGVSAGVDYAVTPYLRVGVAPRLVLNVKSHYPMDHAGKEIDLRARVTGHLPLAQGLELSASLLPGYSIVTSGEDGTDDLKGFALGGAVGLTYDLSPHSFIGAELGYQRAFTSAETEVLGRKVSPDIDMSYMHIGLGAGMRF
jgi:opacity protein-like surface antigen